jgi:hypothetical protein
MLDANAQLALRKELEGMTRKPQALAETAYAALQKCDDAECQNFVLRSALASGVPQHVTPAGEVAIEAAAGFLAGIERGAMGPMVGRVANAVQAAVGLGGGLMSDSIEAKRVGYSVLGGTVAGAAANEGRDLGEWMAAKVHAATVPQK